MTGDFIKTTVPLPARSPKHLGDAVWQWARTRRARMLALIVLLCTIWLGLMSTKDLPSRYSYVSSYYPWNLYPILPEIIDSSFKTPSNLTLQIEKGHIEHIPPRLKKTTPNFHLIMPSEHDADGFCEATLSAMVLKYPPPTVVQLHSGHGASERRHEGILKDTLDYLSNKRLVKGQDLVLIVDAHESRFQLPADVIIAQYKQLLVDANTRLLKRYGKDSNGVQKFNQTIIFGAEKMCEDDDVACKYVPPSIFPDDMYGTETGRRISETAAKFLNGRMVMGPASDLRALYEAAHKKFQEHQSQSQTVQSVFATLFAEQQLSRDAYEVATKSSSAKFKDFIQGRPSESAAKQRLIQARQLLSNFTHADFSIGLDYTHTLFQPLSYITASELVPITHNNSTNLTQYIHNHPDPSYLSLPTALTTSTPPFSRPGLTTPPTPSTNHPAHIAPLSYTPALDTLPNRSTPWSSLPLIQNTFTGAIPAILTFPSSSASTSNSAAAAPNANISWRDFWYHEHKRAMLRSVFRRTQSAEGYHDAAVGGDRHWDVRGGLGGVWTAGREGAWVPWGVEGGVCGSEQEFGDGKGAWLSEEDGEVRRRTRGRRRKRWDLEGECVRYC